MSEFLPILAPIVLLAWGFFVLLGARPGAGWGDHFENVAVGGILALCCIPGLFAGVWLLAQLLATVM